MARRVRPLPRAALLPNLPPQHPARPRGLRLQDSGCQRWRLEHPLRRPGAGGAAFQSLAAAKSDVHAVHRRTAVELAARNADVRAAPVAVSVRPTRDIGAAVARTVGGRSGACGRTTANQRSARPRTVRAIVPARDHRVLPHGHHAAELAVLGVASVFGGAVGGVRVLTALRARLGAVPAGGPSPASLPGAAPQLGARCGARTRAVFLWNLSDASVRAVVRVGPARRAPAGCTMGGVPGAARQPAGLAVTHAGSAAHPLRCAARRSVVSPTGGMTPVSCAHPTIVL